MLRSRYRFLALVAAILLCGHGSVLAHEGHSHDDENATEATSETDGGSTSDPDQGSSDRTKNAKGREIKRRSLRGPTVEAFSPFASKVTARATGGFMIVESDGLPDHDMMVGIRAWQQQVPIPQPFVGSNAWRIPLNPRPASQPISVRREPLRGAIALAVNGVPIFCALNNRAEDTFLAGELDEWGGHCGRGDDYHYHVAPVHLEKTVGVGNPIAFALDGYPILGLTEADGKTPNDLDLFNGHTHDGHYHYHATKTFPYVNGGLHGVVTMRGDQIEQPRDSPLRPGQRPLRGAKITGFQRDGNEFDVQYEVSGREAHVRYKVLDDNRVEFTHEGPAGRSTTTTYQRGRSRRGSFPGWGTFLGLMLIGLVVMIRRRSWHLTAV